MENSIHIGKLVGGLLLGAAIVGTLGILYAPIKRYLQNVFIDQLLN